MARNDKNLQGIYNTLKAEGYTPPEYEQFVSDMQDDKNLRGVYDTLNKHNYTPPEFETFKSDMFSDDATEEISVSDTSTPAIQPAQDAKNSDDFPSMGLHAKNKSYDYEAPSDASPVIQDDVVENATGAFQVNNWPPTAIQRDYMSMQANVPANRVKAIGERMVRHHENLAEYDKRMGRGQVVQGDTEFNAETGKLEQTYLTPTGNKTTNKEVAELETQEQYVDNMTIAGQLRRAGRDLKRLNQMRENRIQAIYDKHEGYAEPAASVLGVSAYGPSIESDPEYKALTAAIHQAENRLRIIQHESDRQNGKDVGYWRGFGEVVGDVKTWDFGYRNLTDAITMLGADSNLSSNKTAGHKYAEQIMMEQAYKAQQAQASYGQNDSFWNRAGVMTGEMLPFMLDFAIMGGAKGGTSMVTRNLDAILLRSLHKAAPKVARNKAVQWTTKALGAMPEDLLYRAPLMTNTVQGMKTSADIIDRKLGDVVIREDGTYDFSNDKTWGSAVWQGEANAIIENYSEMFGTHLEGALSLKNVGKLADTFGAKRLSGILTKASNGELAGIAGTMQKHLNRLGVSDYVGEVGEEYYGQLWRTMLNLDDAYKQNPDGTRTNLFLDGQFRGDIWGGMALSMGLMGAGKYSISAAAYGSMKHRVNKADAKASMMFTPEVWDGWRARIDGTTNDKIGEMAEAIVADPALTNEQREAAMNYIETSMNLRGFNLASVARQRGGEMPEDESAANESYMDGYSATTPQEMSDTRNMLELQRQRLVSALSEDLVPEFDNDPVGALSRTHEPELRRIASDYVNAKMVYDGMIQRVRDDIDSKMAHSDAVIERRSNKTTGLIQPVRLKDGRNVYIVNGNIAMTDDGAAVNVAASDKDLIVCDDEGNLEFITPSSIVTIGDAVDAEQEKETARQAIQEEMATAAVDNINHTLSFAQGETYTGLSYDELINMTVVGQTVDKDGVPVNGSVDVQLDDGTVLSLPHETVQSMVDMADMQRVQNVQPTVVENSETAPSPTENTIPEGESVIESISADDSKQSALSKIPTDQSGEPIYEQSEPDIAWDALVEQTEGDEDMAKNVIEQTISEKEDALQKLSKQKPKAGLSTTQKIQAEKDKKKAMDGIQQSIEYWRRMHDIPQQRSAAIEAEMQAEQERIAEHQREAEVQAKAIAEAESLLRKEIAKGNDERGRVFDDVKEYPEAVEILQDRNPHNIMEVAAMVLSGNKILLSDHGGSRGYKTETGLGEAERKKLFGMFASAEKGGKSIARLSEDAMKAVCDEYGVPYDNQEAYNALLEVLRSSNTPSDIHRYIDNARMAQAKDVAETMRQREDEMDQAFHQDAYHMGREDYQAYNEARQAALPDMGLDFDEQEFYGNIADEMAVRSVSGRATTALNTDNYGRTNEQTRYELSGRNGLNDTNGTGTTHAVGSEVLPGAQSDQTDRTGAGAGQQGGAEGLGIRVRDAQVSVPESTPGSINSTEQSQDGTGPTERGGGAADDSTAGGAAVQNNIPEKKEVTSADPRTMPDDEKARRGDMLRNAPAIEVAVGQIVATKELSARKAAEQWWDENVAEPAFYDTEVGEVEINKNSVESSLAHKYGQMKLDAITSLIEGFENAVYLGTMPDFTRQEGVSNHFFAYPINYNGKRCYVFCRAMQDANKDRLYVHEVFVSDKIKKGDTLQTAASQPHGGIALYRDILANVLLSPNSSEWHLAEHPSDVPDLLPMQGKSEISNRKITNYAQEKQDNDTESSIGERIAEAEAEVNTTPTDGQKKAGNYKKGHVQVGTFDVTIENPKGSKRSGTDPDGKKWETTMTHTYGYILGTKGVDGDHIDVYISSDIDGWNGRKVFVVDQYNPDGSFDEHKVMLGFNDKDEAFEAYLSNYEAGWEKGRRLDVTAANLDDFEKWIESSKRKTKAFADYKSARAEMDSEQTSGIDYLNDESREAVLRYVERYGSAPIIVIRDKADIDAASLSEDAKAELKDVFDGGGIMAVYCHENKKIYIFANDSLTAGEIEPILRHENVHALIDVLGAEGNEFAHRFHNSVVTVNSKAIKILDRELPTEYEQETVDEEFLAYVTQYALSSQKFNDKVLAALDQQDREYYLNKIFNVINGKSEKEAGQTNNNRNNEETISGSLSGGRKTETAANRDLSQGGQESEAVNPSFNVGADKAPNAVVYGAAKSLLEQVGIEVVEVSDAEAQRMLEGRGGDERLMGSRTDRKMEKIGEHYAGKELDGNQQAVVDVFSGKADNLPVEVQRADGKRRVIMRQGDEQKAGTKHSLFRHFGTKSNNIEAEDIAMVPEIIAKGERTVNGNKVAYDYVAEDDARLRVTTEMRKNGHEEFTNLISNRKPQTSEYRQAQKGNTQSSARTTEAEVSDAKIGNSDVSGKIKLLKTPQERVYGWVADSKVYLNRDAMNPETPLHEYTHLWDEMVQKENPELWARGKELLRQAPIWGDVVNDSNYANIRDDEDAIASEVHSRLTGKDGAKLLQEMIDRSRKDGAMATAEAVTLVERIKGWLGEMFKNLKATLSKWSKRDLKELSLEDFNKMTLRDLAEGMNPRYGDRDLAGIHNISEQKLLKALRIGGLVNPSVAIINVNQGSHENYGEISLILPSSMIDKQKGSSGAWPGDAWTPTYPPIERRMGGAGADLPSLDIAKLPQGMRDYVRRSFNGWLDGRGNEGLAYWFLSERGETPDVVRRKRTYTVQEASKILRAVKEEDVFGGRKRKPLSELTDEERSVVKAAYIKFKYEGSEDAYNKRLKECREIWEKLVSDNKEGTLRHMRGATNLAKLEETGLLPGVEQWLNEVQADINAGNREEPELTSLEANKIINEQGLRDEFDKWVDGLLDRYGIEEVIFDGYTPSGERRYVKNTAKNASRIMREQGKNASTGWFSSFSKFVAAVLKPMNKRDDIRKGKYRLTTNHDELDAFDVKWSDVFFDLGMKCQPDATGRFDDYGMERLTEAVGKKEPLAYLKSEYGVNLSSEDAMRLMSMIEAIRKERPAMYFEKKYERPVQLNEFAAAVIPHTAGKEVREALSQAGVKVVEYDSAKDGDRRRALREASDNNVRFHAAMAHGREDFEAMRDRAVAERGIVMPGLNDAEVKVVEVPRHDFKGTGKEALKAAEDWAKTHIVGTHTAIDGNGSEFEYSISNDAVEKYVSRSATGKSDNIGVHLAALKKLPEIIAESIEAEVHADYKKQDGVRGAHSETNPESLVHRFYGAVNIEGKKYRVKTTFREYSDPNMSTVAHSYEVTQIELLEAPSDNALSTGEPLAMTSNNSIAVAKLLKGVEKSYDPGKKLLDESAAVDDLQRMGDGNGAYSDAEVSMENDPWSKAWGQAFRSKKRQAEFAARERQRMISRVQELAERMHLNNVEIVTDTSQLAGKLAKAKGFYNKSTNKITIVIPNNTGWLDAEQTLLHEAVAHYGLRQLFGKQFDTFLDNVYEASEDSIKEQIDLLASRNGWDRRVATEEYLASLAETTNFESMNQSWWQKIKRLFLDMMDRIGLTGFRESGVVLTDNELRYLLWCSYQNLANPGRYRSFLTEAEDIAMQDKLKVGNYVPLTEPVTEQSVAEAGELYELNEQFNRELQRQMDGTLEIGHVYKLGMPSKELLSTGIPRLPIRLSASILNIKSNLDRHAYDLSAIRNLVNAIQKPWAIFAYGDQRKAQNLIIGIEDSGRQFLVGVSINPTVKGRSLEINSIRNVFPKNNHEWVNWINEGKLLRIDGKKEIQTIIAKLRMNPVAFDYVDLDNAAKIVENFENPAIDVQNNNNQHDDSVLFRDGDFTPRDRAIAAQQYEQMLSRGSWQFREATQDSMLGLKTLYESILGSNLHIENVAGYENAYLYENRMSSANNGEQHQYFSRFMKPLLESIHKLCGSKELDRRILTDYMMAKHGLERNEYMRNEAAANGEDTKRDFAGLCGLTGEDDWQVAETVAQQMVDDYEADHNTTELWDNVQKATNATLEKIYLSGLISEDTYNKVLGMYDFYIPLRGWDETTSDEVYGYLTSKDGPLMGSVFKTAEGRDSKADDPIATIAMMADDAIRQGNRNIMKQRFLNFVHGNPSDLVSVNEMWLQHNDVTDEWEPVFADLQPNMTHAEVESEIAKFEAKMEALRTAEPDKYKKGGDARNIPYKVVRGNLNEHQVLVKRNGRTYVITINGNPRAAQALNGLTNPDTDVSGVASALASLGTRINRELSALYTTRNPNFVVSNFMRDMLYSNCMSWVKEDPRYARQFFLNCGRFAPISPRRTIRWTHGFKGGKVYSIGMLLRKWETQTLDMNDPYEKMFSEFMLNGGETGYTSVKDIERHKTTIAAELKKHGSVGREAWSALGMQLDLLNRSAENCARFAAYVTSREMGRTIDRSIWDAKEVSVNFNKKGSGGKLFGKNGQTFLGNLGAGIGWAGRGMFAFWNAGIQGVTNYGRAAKRNPAKAATTASTLIAFGCVVPMLAQMLGGGDGDDDDKNAYYNLPEYVRRSNICFKAGEQWITIPLPIEFRALYGIGELSYGVISGNERYSDSELIRQMAAQVSQVMPLDMLEGGGGLSPFIPTMAKPVVEAYIRNKGWTGLPIYVKETPYNKYAPEWKRVYQSTDQNLVDFTRWLNEVSGGGDYLQGHIDINPAKIEYLLKGYLGGAYSFSKQLWNTGEIVFGDREFAWRDIPLANRLIKSGGDRTAYRKLQNEYFKYKEEAGKTEYAYKGYTKDADQGILKAAERADFIYNSDEFMRYQILEKYEPELEALRKMKNDATGDLRLQYESEYYATMRKAIEEIHESEQQKKQPESKVS